KDPAKLRTWIVNARRENEKDIADAAFRRLADILPSEKPGTVEFDFWRTLHAFELLLTEENGRTTRLSRTRQKVGRVGVTQTLTDWSSDTKETRGFAMLLERGMPELTGEAIVLRHPSDFSDTVRASARQRLVEAGVDVDQLPNA
ncbi:MAG: hypothetical protein DI629_17810, partial [Mesorhizobium amorphae]